MFEKITCGDVEKSNCKLLGKTKLNRINNDGQFVKYKQALLIQFTIVIM